MFKYTVYAKDTPDANGKYWYFYCIHTLKVWKFWYYDVKPKPRDKIFGLTVSEYDPELL